MEKYRAKGSCDATKMRWVVIDGSIYTDEIVESRSDNGVFVKARISIAFNVGDKLAKYIVDLHNWDLDGGNSQ